MPTPKNNTIDIYANETKGIAIIVINDTQPLIVNYPLKMNVDSFPTMDDLDQFIRDNFPHDLPGIDLSIPFDVSRYVTGKTSRDGITFDAFETIFD